MMSTGYELRLVADATVGARGRKLLSTCTTGTLPLRSFGLITPKSCMASRYGLDVCAGVVHAGSESDVAVVLFNHSGSDVYLKAGDEVAQLLIVPFKLGSV